MDDIIIYIYVRIPLYILLKSFVVIKMKGKPAYVRNMYGKDWWEGLVSETEIVLRH